VSESALIVDGYYEGEFHALLFRRGTVRLRVDKGRLTGITGFGVPLDGTYAFDPVRKTYAYVMTAHMPAFFEAITGLVTGANGRSVTYRGEATPVDGKIRFSIDFAGKAIDVLLWRVGPPSLADGKFAVPPSAATTFEGRRAPQT
jgi:hypothetical protein